MWHQRTSIRRRPTWGGEVDLVHGFGGVDVPGRCGVDPRLPPPRSRAVDPCIPRLERLRDRFSLPPARYEIQVSNPNGVTRGRTSLTLDGTTLDPGAELKLVDDGLTHQVRSSWAECRTSRPTAWRARCVRKRDEIGGWTECPVPLGETGLLRPQAHCCRPHLLGVTLDFGFPPVLERSPNPSHQDPSSATLVNPAS